MKIEKLRLRVNEETVREIWGRAPLPARLRIEAWFESAGGIRGLFFVGADRIVGGVRGRLVPFDDPVAAAVRLYRARLSAVGGRARSPAKAAAAAANVRKRWAAAKKGDAP